MNAIRAYLREFKESMGLTPIKTVKLSTGIVLEHYFKKGTKTVEIRIKSK